MKSQRATASRRAWVEAAYSRSARRHRRSDSGAVVRRTRGGELGGELGGTLAVRRTARAEASRRGGPQLTLHLGPAGFNPLDKRIAWLGCPAGAALRAAGFGCVFLARLGKSSQNARVHFDDFPVKAWRAGSANLFSRPRQFLWVGIQPTHRICLLRRAGDCRAANRTGLPSGRAGPTSRGRAKLTFRCGCVGPIGRGCLRVDTASKTPCGCVYSERQRN